MEMLCGCLTMFFIPTVHDTAKYTPYCQRRHVSSNPATSPFIYNGDQSVGYAGLIWHMGCRSNQLLSGWIKVYFMRSNVSLILLG